MRTVSIPCKGQTRAPDFDLHHLLTVLAEFTRDLRWKVSGSEALGDAADELHAIDDGGKLVSTGELLRIAARVSQTIEGHFKGHGPSDAGRPQLVLRAVDGTCWDVSSDDDRVLDCVRAEFDAVRELDDVGYGA